MFIMVLCLAPILITEAWKREIHDLGVASMAVKNEKNAPVSWKMTVKI
jgi:hypothetical protein